MPRTNGDLAADAECGWLFLGRHMQIHRADAGSGSVDTAVGAGQIKTARQWLAGIPAAGYPSDFSKLSVVGLAVSRGFAAFPAGKNPFDR